MKEIKNFDKLWAEYAVLLFLLVGLFLGLSMRTPAFSYVSIILIGFLFGRFYYSRRFSEPILPFILMIVAFALGYLIANFGVQRFMILVLFILSFGISYFLHVQKIFTIFKSKDFLK